MITNRLAQTDSRKPTRASSDRIVVFERLFVALTFGLLIPSQELRAQNCPVPPCFIVESTIDDFVPYDVDITPNGTLAVVRSCDLSQGSGGPNSITVWETATGVRRSLTTAPGISIFGQGLPPTPSDLVAVSNDRAVVIGSDFDTATTGTTYIDVIDLGVNPPKVFWHHTIGSGTNAGDANDVAITRNGRYAVVNHKGGIRVIDLYGDPGAIPPIQAGDIALPIDFPGSDPGAAVDSVAVTNSRAIVVTAAWGPGSQLQTWVYIIRLDVSPPALVAPRDHMTAGGYNETYDPHDVAITPDGSMAVVVSNRAVGVYNLQSGAKIGPTIFDGWTRYYRQQVDSVEVSNDRAVIIGSRFFTNDAWAVDVYRLDLAQGLVFLREWASLSSLDPPHDVEISPDYGKAAIKTRNRNLVINNLPALTGPELLLTDLPSNGDPNLDSGIPPFGTFVSDSVDLTQHTIVPVQPPDDGQRQFAVFIGAFQPSSPPGAPRAASIEVVDLVPIPALPVVTVPPWTISNATWKTVPADLNLHGVLGPLLVRFNAPPDETTGQQANGRDYRQFTLQPLGMLDDIGGQGFIFAMDSLVSSTTRAVSVAENSNPPTVTFQKTFVHLVNTQFVP